MTPETTPLILSGLLQMLHLQAFGAMANKIHGARRNVGPRDHALVFEGLAGRFERAMNNHIHALGLFTVAVVALFLAEASNQLTLTCAWIYVVARVLYVPAYVSGVPFVRSALWTAAAVATLIMLIVALWAQL